VNVLILRDQSLACTVHGMLPAREATKVVAQRERPIAQSASVTLSPNKTLAVSWLKLAMDTQDSAIAIDDDLAVEERVAIRNSLGDAKIDGHSRAPTGVLDGTDIFAVGLDNNALLGILC
tara:strand:+ start:24487 stop:24846 length:360 start_codon:yes stop_codon:yes gene_type:complete